jgi:hypothetical protein
MFPARLAQNIAKLQISERFFAALRMTATSLHEQRADSSDDNIKRPSDEGFFAALRMTATSLHEQRADCPDDNIKGQAMWDSSLRSGCHAG